MFEVRYVTSAHLNGAVCRVVCEGYRPLPYSILLVHFFYFLILSMAVLTICALAPFACAVSLYICPSSCVAILALEHGLSEGLFMHWLSPYKER